MSENFSRIIHELRVDFIITDDVQKPQWAFFSKVPGNGSMKPSVCKLASLHPTHIQDKHMSLQTNCTQCRTVGTLPILGFVSEDTLGLEVLRSEIPSGMCAKIRTAAASNNRDHASQSLTIACSHHAHIFLFFAHIPFVMNHTINATPPERLQQNHPVALLLQ